MQVIEQSPSKCRGREGRRKEKDGRREGRRYEGREGFPYEQKMEKQRNQPS